MTKQLTKELINSWDWLDAFCLTQRGICELACGKHAIVVIQINQLDEIKKKLSREEYEKLIKQFEEHLETYALEDTIIAKYNESTYVVVLHYLASREEINEICEEIDESVSVAMASWVHELSITIGAAECHHDPSDGYKCAAKLALEALQEAKEKNKEFVLAEDTLAPNPMALRMKRVAQDK